MKNILVLTLQAIVAVAFGVFTCWFSVEWFTGIYDPCSYHYGEPSNSTVFVLFLFGVVFTICFAGWTYSIVQLTIRRYLDHVING